MNPFQLFPIINLNVYMEMCKPFLDALYGYSV